MWKIPAMDKALENVWMVDCMVQPCEMLCGILSRHLQNLASNPPARIPTDPFGALFTHMCMLLTSMDLNLLQCQDPNLFVVESCAFDLIPDFLIYGPLA